MTEKTTYDFVLWGVPRFHRGGVFQEQAYDAGAWDRDAKEPEGMALVDEARPRAPERVKTLMGWH